MEEPIKTKIKAANRNEMFVSSLIERINKMQTYKLFPEDDRLVCQEEVCQQIREWASEYTKPVHYWEKVRADGFSYWRCTACKAVHYLEPPRWAYFCPGCGVPMKTEVEE